MRLYIIWDRYERARKGHNLSGGCLKIEEMRGERQAHRPEPNHLLEQFKRCRGGGPGAVVPRAKTSGSKQNRPWRE